MTSLWKVTVIVLCCMFARLSESRYNAPCRLDSDCNRRDVNLRCFPVESFDDRRCLCKRGHRFENGKCVNTEKVDQPGNGQNGDGEKDSDKEQQQEIRDLLVSVFLPTAVLMVALLVASIACCFNIHMGNRDIHQQLKAEEKKQKYLARLEQANLQIDQESLEEKVKRHRSTDDLRRPQSSRSQRPNSSTLVNDIQSARSARQGKEGKENIEVKVDNELENEYEEIKDDPQQIASKISTDRQKSNTQVVKNVSESSSSGDRITPAAFKKGPKDSVAPLSNGSVPHGSDRSSSTGLVLAPHDLELANHGSTRHHLHPLYSQKRDKPGYGVSTSPLHGMLQPTGLKPSGYQASMRFLFSNMNRPSSAVSVPTRTQESFSLQAGRSYSVNSLAPETGCDSEFNEVRVYKSGQRLWNGRSSGTTSSGSSTSGSSDSDSDTEEPGQEGRDPEASRALNGGHSSAMSDIEEPNRNILRSKSAQGPEEDRKRQKSASTLPSTSRNEGRPTSGIKMINGFSQDDKENTAAEHDNEKNVKVNPSITVTNAANSDAKTTFKKHPTGHKGASSKSIKSASSDVKPVQNGHKEKSVSFSERPSILSSSSNSLNSLASSRQSLRSAASRASSGQVNPNETVLEKILRERNERNLKINTKTKAPISIHFDPSLEPTKSILKKPRKSGEGRSEGKKKKKKINFTGEYSKQRIFASPTKEKEGVIVQNKASKNRREGSVNYGYVMEADAISETVTWVKVPLGQASG